MSVEYFKDNIVVTTTTTGTGTLTQSAAVAGFSAPAAGDDGKTFAIAVFEVDSGGKPNGQWEVTQSVYTHSGTTWSRGTLLASSTGVRVSFAAGTKYINVVLPTDVISQLAYLNGKSGGQKLIGGTAGGNTLTLAANTTDDAATTNVVIVSGGGLQINVAGARAGLYGSASIINRSVEVGTDPLGAAPGNAGLLKLWTDDDGAGEPAISTNLVQVYAWDFAAGDARLKVKGEVGNAVYLGNGQVQADQLVSVIADGTAPLIVTSKTVVTNLNADTVGGVSGTDLLTRGQIVAIASKMQML